MQSKKPNLKSLFRIANGQLIQHHVYRCMRALLLQKNPVEMCNHQKPCEEWEEQRTQRQRRNRRAAPSLRHKEASCSGNSNIFCMSQSRDHRIKSEPRRGHQHIVLEQKPFKVMDIFLGNVGIFSNQPVYYTTLGNIQIFEWL